jgi:hypothetical protein
VHRQRGGPLGMTRSGFLAEGARKLLRALSDQGEARKD